MRARRVIVPVGVQMTLTCRFLQDLIKKERFAEVASSLRPWCLDTDPPYSDIAPRFSSLIDLCTSQASQDEAANCLLEVYYGNAGIDLFAEPCEGKSGLPAMLASAILREYESLSYDDSESEFLLCLPEPIVNAMDEIMKGCRAVVAVTYPEPGYLGSAYGDVQDLFGDRLSPSGCALFTKTANQDRLVPAVLKNKEWRSRIDTYWSDAKEDSAIAPTYNELCRGWSAYDFQDDAIVQKTFSVLPKWKERLRPQGCKQLIDGITQRVNTFADTQPLDELSTWQQALLTKVVLETSPLTNDTNLHKLRGTLQERLAHVEKNEALDTLGHAMVSWNSDFQGLQEIASAIHTLSGEPLPQELVNKARGLRLQLCVQLVHLGVSQTAAKLTDESSKFLEMIRKVLAFLRGVEADPSTVGLDKQEAQLLDLNKGLQSYTSAALTLDIEVSTNMAGAKATLAKLLAELMDAKTACHIVIDAWEACDPPPLEPLHTLIKHTQEQFDHFDAKHRSLADEVVR